MSDAENDAERLVEDELVHSVRLSMVPGVGPRMRRALLERFGSPEAVFEASPSDLVEVRGVGRKLTEQIVAATETIDVDEEIALCRREGVTILTDGDDAYPSLLREIPDPPGVLYLRGNLRPQDGMAIAIVGTRHATPYGLRTAEQLAGSLARAGLCVVSGLARGVDTAAHRGALAAGARTVAVLGSGVLNVYPPEHRTLAEEIIGRGALISEVPPRAAPKAGVFPQRNRIISGLSLGVIIVEAGDRSGALITARLAMEQGREVFAVPGRIDSRPSRGCHRLIRDGAKLVQSADDVLEELGPLFEPTPREDGQVVHHPAELQLNDLEQKVLAAVTPDPIAIDQIVATTGLPVARVLSTLSVLEMRHLVRRASGNAVFRL